MLIVRKNFVHKFILSVIIGLAPFFDFIVSRQLGLIQTINVNDLTRNYNLPFLQLFILIILLFRGRVYFRPRQFCLAVILILFSIRLDLASLLNFLMILYPFLLFCWLYENKKLVYVNTIFITYAITGVMAFFVRIFFEGINYEQARYGLNIFGGFPILMILIMLMQLNYQNFRSNSLSKLYLIITFISIVFSSRTGMALTAMLTTRFVKIRNSFSIFFILMILFFLIPREILDFTLFRIMLIIDNFDGISSVLLESGALYGRLGPWNEGWTIAVENPLLGVGYGRYFFASANGWSNAHNEVLNLLAQMGFIFGGITSAALIFSMLPRKRFSISGLLFFMIWLIGILVSGFSLTQFPGIHSSLNLLMIFILLEVKKWI